MIFGLEIYQVLLIAFILAAGLTTLGTGKDGIRNGFLFFIVSLSLGYRSVYLTDAITLHPAELLIWFLFFLYIFLRRRFEVANRPVWLPGWLKLLVPFWLLAWITGLAANRSWEWMLQESKNFLVLVPLFVVGQHILAERRNWPPVLLTFFLTGAWIGGLGLLEYYFPGVLGSIPGFAADPVARATLEGFSRATFSFYGSPVATFLLAVSLPLVNALWEFFPNRRQRLLLVLAAATQVAGIYIGGYRSIWIVMIFEIFLWVILRLGLVPGLLALGISVPLSAALFPQVAEERLMTLLLAAEGVAVESSAAKRIARGEEAWTSTLANPLGSGWSGSGWVHNDFLQISVGQGILPALILVIAWLRNNILLLTGIFRQRKQKQSSRLAEALLIALAASGAVMVFQGTTWLVFTAIPMWFAWMLADAWLRESPSFVNAGETEANPDAKPEELQPWGKVPGQP